MWMSSKKESLGGVMPSKRMELIFRESDVYQTKESVL